MVVLSSLFFFKARDGKSLRMLVLLRSVIPFLFSSRSRASPEQTLVLIRVDWQQVVFGACHQHKSVTGVSTVRTRYFLFHFVPYKASYQLNNQQGVLSKPSFSATSHTNSHRNAVLAIASSTDRCACSSALDFDAFRPHTTTTARAISKTTTISQTG
jgi:hypothetical protein